MGYFDYEPRRYEHETREEWRKRRMKEKDRFLMLIFLSWPFFGFLGFVVFPAISWYVFGWNMYS